MALAQAHAWVFTIALIILALMAVLCLVRAVIGPTIADRLVAVNMMGTMVMVIISILAVRMNEGYLVDICLIYAMISFLSVVVLTKVYSGVYLERQDKKRKLEEAEKKEGEQDDANS
ncbi:MAG: cation:proton antiporter [Eubacteriales bacterium]|nr:cation:proton antiporter [Eubacteriales bacterium]